MQPYQERVMQEKQELDKKISQLGEFTSGRIYPTLAQDEQDRLSRQYVIMRDYSSVLGERITNFPPPSEAIIP
jgi:hypothetical protein